MIYLPSAATFIANIICLFIPSKSLRRRIRYKISPRVQAACEFEDYKNKKIYQPDESQKIIMDILNSDSSCMIGRFGQTEFSALYYYLKYGKLKKNRDGLKIMNSIRINAGFFPSNPESVCLFAKELVEASKLADAMCIIRCKGEADFLRTYCPDAPLIEAAGLASMNYKNPWTQSLKGKKILVIHPYSSSIIEQYKKRNKLFDNPDILPQFKLQTIRAIQSSAGNDLNIPFSSWFEVLEYLKKEIDKIDFDIAVIGAGSYGMSLASYCKKLGKKAIYMGSDLQMLFGIYGKRWEESSLINEHWIRPSSAETPKNYKQVEDGCYW